MKLVPLAQVAAQVQGGAPLPFSVRDAQGGLLLARGNLISGDAMRQSLLERGAFVDMDEVRAAQHDSSLPVGERRLNHWRGLMTRLSLALQDPASKGLETSIRGVATELATLVQADADMAQALLVHPELCAGYPYSVAHSAHAAATWALLALRQGDATPASLTVPLAAALTMNLAMLSLQDRLTHQELPLKLAQREQVRQHAAHSAALLRAVGVDDALWLAMVEQHHDAAAGDSAPGAASAGPLAEAARLRMIDIYCACFGARAKRAPLLPDQAARRLFQQHAKDPTALALAREFGLYPPGTVVRLASLELALVVRRGPSANAPVAIALQNASGEARAPVRRDTSQPGHAIVTTVTPSLLRVRIPWAQLFTLF
jgi:hypothetical protein